jgi:hypothetical protein
VTWRSIRRGPYTIEPAPIAGGARFELREDGEPLTWNGVAARWRDDPTFREAFVDALASAPLEAFFWETVPCSGATCDRVFGQVLLDSPALARVRTEPGPFRRELAGAEGDVAAFDNLGGDARLVVPGPTDALEPYAHLAAFVRGAPRSQVHRLLERLGAELERRWSETEGPVWVSTSGLGVYWVHVRLDSRPKYVTHPPYRRFDA